MLWTKADYIYGLRNKLKSENLRKYGLQQKVAITNVSNDQKCTNHRVLYSRNLQMRFALSQLISTGIAVHQIREGTQSNESKIINLVDNYICDDGLWLSETRP